jgi:hypothetical protein
MEKKWTRIRDEHPRSFFGELRNSFFGFPGSGMEKFGSGSATLPPIMGTNLLTYLLP